MASKSVSKEAALLLKEAINQRPPPKKSWLDSLPDDKRQAIIEAYRELPEKGVDIAAFVRAIKTLYGVSAAESSIRHTLRTLDTK